VTGVIKNKLALRRSLVIFIFHNEWRWMYWL
jgi:hypothetical protein